MTPEQKSRYKELMWIAQFGDYMSELEYSELNALMNKLNAEKKGK